MSRYDFDSSNDNFYLEYKKRPLQESIKKEHYHSAWEFYFYLGESMTFFLNDTSYNVKKYDLVFVDRHVYHKTSYKDNDKERILILLRGDFFSLFADKTPIYNFLLSISKLSVLSFEKSLKLEIYDDFLKLSEIYENEGSESHNLQIFFAAFLAKICALIKQKRVFSCSAIKNKNSVVISQITNYINNHYNEAITLAFLSEKFFIDKYHLCHIFKKATGMTIIDFLNQKRIIEAGILLKGTARPISEISGAVGFQNQNYFGTTFKKYYKMSPREYRQNG